MSAVLLAVIAAQALGLWLLASLYGDARHRADRAETNEAKLRARLSQREPRPVVRVSVEFPAELPAQRALPPAVGDELALGCGDAWPDPPAGHVPSVIDVPAWTQEIPVVSFDDIDGDGTREFCDREAQTVTTGRACSRVPADQTVTRVRHGFSLGLWEWLASWWPGTVTHA